MQCHYCEEEKQSLPFRCNYCGNYYCSDHRLPENHACPRVGGPKQPGYSDVPSLQEKYAKTRGHVGGFPSIGRGRSRFRFRYPGVFSKTERKHILLATAMVSLVGLSIQGFGFVVSEPLVLLIDVVGFAVSFLGHELAHKFFAQRNGLWAEFRINIYGLLMTVVSIFFPIKFLAPGQVSIVGGGNRELQGAIAIIGPGFNILFGTALLLASIVVGPRGLVGGAFAAIAIFNGYMAVFNLIPFMGFDGLRAFEWDTTRWAIALVASVGLLVSSLYFAFFLGI